MTTVQKQEVLSKAIELAEISFGQFCEDISGMFEIDIDYNVDEPQNIASTELGKKFKKLSGLISFKTDGIMDGKFHIIIDHAGIFTLSGTMAMLSSKLIEKNIKHGSKIEAEEQSDAFGEVGNLLVSSWNRIFRENMNGHGHFAQNGTFVSESWAKMENVIGLSNETEFVYIPCELTLGEFAAFQCSVIYPESIFNETETEDAQQDTEEASLTDEQSEVEQNSEETPQAETQSENEQSIEDIQQTTQPEDAQPITKADEIPVEATTEQNSKTNDESPQITIEMQPKVAMQTETQTTAEESKSEIAETINKIVSSPAALPGIHNNVLHRLSTKDAMRTDIAWASADESVADASKKLQQSDCGYILIGTDGNVEGIVSNSDINSAVSIYLKPAFSKWRRPVDDATLQIKLKWVMSKLVYTISPDAPLQQVVAKMSQNRCRALPVVDSKGKTVGLITIFEIFNSIIAN